MKAPDRKQFIDIMNKAAIIFDKDITKDLLDVYWQYFTESTIDQFREAMNMACKQTEFFPKPVRIIECIESLKPKPSIEVMAHQQTGYFVQMLLGKDWKNPKGWKEDPTTKALLSGQFLYSFETALERDVKWLGINFLKAYLETYDFVDKKLIDADPEKGLL